MVLLLLFITSSVLYSQDDSDLKAKFNAMNKEFAEMMVDLVKMAGYPAVSRAGLYQKQPKKEFDELRDYLGSNVCAEHFYIKQMKDV